jgi:hypothetical protein
LAEATSHTQFTRKGGPKLRKDTLLLYTKIDIDIFIQKLS